MHTQINIPTNSESGLIPQRGDTNTFQKDKSKEEILENSSVNIIMMYNIVMTKETVRLKN